jgi:hypothetical protein
MPPLLDSILGLFPPLGVSSVSHDSPAGIHPFSRRVTRRLSNPDNNAYDTLSVQSIGADCDPEPLLVKAEMWLRILRTSMCGNHGNWDDRISQLYNIVNSALPIRVLPL